MGVSRSFGLTSWLASELIGVFRGLMTAPATLVRFTTVEGLGEHCHVASLTRAHQVIFDWLDTAISAARAGERNGATTVPARP